MMFQLMRRCFTLTRGLDTFFMSNPRKLLSVTPHFTAKLKASQLTKENLPPNLGCPVCSRGISFTKNDVLFLSQFMSPEGRMLDRRITGLCGKQHRLINKYIHISRREGLLPRKPPKDGGKPPQYGQKSKSLTKKTYLVRFI